MSQVSKSDRGYRTWNKGHLQVIKMRTLALIDSIGLDDSELGQVQPPETIVNVKQNQKLNQDMDLNNLSQQVTDLDLPSSERKELKEIVNNFQDELQKQNSSSSKIKSLYKSAAEISQDVAINMIVIALKMG